jgi:hypothetical protein
MMTRAEALARLDEITRGIDATEGGYRCLESDNWVDDPDLADEGWWEVSPGAEFGAERLAMLRQLIVELT